jgi:hypothetical protein
LVEDVDHRCTFSGSPTVHHVSMPFAVSDAERPETFHRTNGHQACPPPGQGEEEMKSLVRSIGIGLGVLTLAGAQNASAQIVDPIEFTTSFAFTVGNTTLPAGNYTAKADDDNPQIFELTGKNAVALFAVEQTTSRQVPSMTEVVFNRYGDTYVLKSLWMEGSTSGVTTTAAEGERHAAKAAVTPREQRLVGRKAATTSGQ